MSYATARAMTEAELSAIRQDGQWMRVRMVVVPQQTVLACKASGSLAGGNDSISSIGITAITSGSVANVQAGMTCYVGSGSGLDDYGMVRVKACSAGRISFARASGIPWSSSVHLTVVDDFGLWHKLPVLDTEATTTAIMMDDNVVYDDQNTNMAPVPVFGPDCAFSITSGSIVYDGSNSWCPDTTETITSWAWTACTGGAPSASLRLPSSGSAVTSASAVSGSVVAFVPSAPGSYTIGLTVTASNGATATGHRSVYVYNETTHAPIENVQLTNFTAERDAGGWTAEVTMWADALPSQMRDRAKVILLSTDYYNGSVVPMGQVSGREEVLMVGWIAEEQIEYDSEYSTANLVIRGANYWLQQTVGPSTFLENVTTTPDVWTSMQDLTLDKVAWHFLYWRSTAIEVLDFYPSNITRIIGGMSASIGSIWEQIAETARTRMLAYMAVDRFGRLFIYQDPQVLASGSRTDIPTVLTLDKGDLTEKVNVRRTITNPVSLLEVAGLATAGSAVLMYMSRAPGSLIYNRFGQNDQNDRLVVSSQDDANTLAGMLLAKKNSMYSQVNMTLGHINKMLDVAPPMYVAFSVATGDTIRGFSFTDKKFLILSINYRIDESTGSVMTELELEEETSGLPGYTVVVPQEPVYVFPSYDNDDYDIGYPDLPDLDFPVIDYDPSPFDPITPVISGSSCSGAPENGPYNLYPIGALPTVTSGSVAQLVATIGAGFTIRPTASTHNTILFLRGDFQWKTTDATDPITGQPVVDPITGYDGWETETEDSWWYVEAIGQSGQVVATSSSTGTVTGIPTLRYAEFANNDEVYVTSFKVWMYAWVNSGSAGLTNLTYTFNSGYEGFWMESDLTVNNESEPNGTIKTEWLRTHPNLWITNPAGTIKITAQSGMWWSEYGVSKYVSRLKTATSGCAVIHMTSGQCFFGFKATQVYALSDLFIIGSTAGSAVRDFTTEDVYHTTWGGKPIKYFCLYATLHEYDGQFAVNTLSFYGLESTIAQYRMKLTDFFIKNICP